MPNTIILSYNITMSEITNIEAIILDKDGVFVNFHKLWLRMIAYRAQLIAERSAETSEMLIKIRTNCIRAMGIDEDDEAIDPFGPCSLPAQEVRVALATALFITCNEVDPTYSWSSAFRTVDESMDQAKTELSLVDLSEPIPGSIEKIKDLVKSGFKIAVFTSDSTENINATLEKFGIKNLISGIQAGEVKTQALYEDLCSSLGVKPENTLLVTDSPIDLKVAHDAGAKTVAVLSGVIEEGSASSMTKGIAHQVINSLAELEISYPKKVKA
jgi:phosphoglycolate phosphatase-like HAD superfamily hydrolase